MSARVSYEQSKIESQPSKARGLAAVAFRAAWPALLAFCAVRAVNLLLLYAVASDRGVDFWKLMHSRFDAIWYVGIAEHGYDTEITPLGSDGKPRHSNLAFFPLYPALIWLVSHTLGMSSVTAGLVVSWGFGLVAAWGIFAVGNHLHGRRCGIVLAALWGALPHGVVLSMAYTETLFTALAAWVLLAILEARWVTAGILGLTVGVVRPSAVAVIAAIGVSAAVAIWQRKDGVRPWMAATLCPLGFFGYLAWVGHRVASVTGWFQVQKAWGSPFDAGAYTIGMLGTLLVEQPKKALNVYVVGFVVLLSLGLFSWSVVQRQALPLLTYSFTMLFLAIGTGGFFHSKARLLLPAFPLLLPIANTLAKQRNLRLSGGLISALAIASAAFSLHLRLTWKASP